MPRLRCGLKDLLSSPLDEAQASARLTGERAPGPGSCIVLIATCSRAAAALRKKLLIREGADIGPELPRDKFPDKVSYMEKGHQPDP
jgi:hypothetical protein